MKKENDFELFKKMLMDKVKEEMQRAIVEDELQLEDGAEEIMLNFIDFIIEEEKHDSALLFAKMLISFSIDFANEMIEKQRLANAFFRPFDKERGFDERVMEASMDDAQLKEFLKVIDDIFGGNEEDE